jgi:hypothetical protein
MLIVWQGCIDYFFIKLREGSATLQYNVIVINCANSNDKVDGGAASTPRGTKRETSSAAALAMTKSTGGGVSTRLMACKLKGNYVLIRLAGKGRRLHKK